MIGFERDKVCYQQFGNEDGLVSRQQVQPYTAILAVPLSELFCIPTIKEENGLIWKLAQDYFSPDSSFYE